MVKLMLGSLLYYFSSSKLLVLLLMTLKKPIEHSYGAVEDTFKTNWVAWTKILDARKNSGLRIGSLRALNVSPLIKWTLRIKSDKNFLWDRVIYGIHNLSRKLLCYLAKNLFQVLGGKINVKSHSHQN